MSVTRRQFLTLTGAAAVAWEYLLADTPEQSPNYKMTDHWWGMLIDITKCIGCGNCVRACAQENDVPEGFFRTWVEHYHVDDWHLENPVVESPDGGMHGFPVVARGRGEGFLRPQNVQSMRGFSLCAGVPGGRHLRHAGRSGAGG